MKYILEITPDWDVILHDVPDGALRTETLERIIGADVNILPTLKAELLMAVSTDTDGEAANEIATAMLPCGMPEAVYGIAVIMASEDDEPTGLDYDDAMKWYDHLMEAGV